MGRTVGLINCPICGEKEQEVRENKNGNLYMYCERGCKMIFAAKKSRHIKAILDAGSDYFDANFAIFQQKTTSQPVQHIEKQQEKGVNINAKPTEFGRSNVDGRANGQPGAASGVRPAANGGRGFLAAWLSDDDDE